MKVEDVTPVIDNKEKEEIVEKTPEDEIDVERPENYPFSIEERVSATLNVDTSTKEKFKNQLLGYNIEGFKSSTEKDFIRKFNPVSIRFPSGLWSNFYQWQTDGYQNDSWDNKSHEASLDIYAEKIKGNINDIASLNQEKLTNYGKGFHMMWTYSMNFDDAESCVARAEKDEALGFEIKDIELGNEHFWKSQRSNQTKTEYDYLNRASSVANGLHQRFPEVRVSIPLSWRRTHEEYNKVIIGDQQYFDAISLHKYMGADPDVPGESNSAYSALLTSREVLEEDVLWIRSLAGDKPIWMTEWGVSANSDVEVNSGACLGMADVYLYMAENQNVFDRANWFIFNKALNPMVVVDDRRKPVYPLQKRGYLSVLEIFNEVFMDADIIASSITSTKLNETMNAVNAVMVDKEGKQKIIAVNLSYKTALFKVLFDNQERVQSYKHQALVFEELGPVANIGIDEDPKVLINEEAKNLELPPLSISIIELNN
ncbi:hypothetical protein KMW28_23695 [Flammeovirga yaeyamensis]|uniref:Asl1-like glycosyl hydrolase catalytic domain-containing protein n=1 Tax=Flammeovirga yaeyamensis TaxID=367791 RepID=A0AAX1ND83_9BACT|nr:hypothetical protein [Flammeovirga yaeyamensis]MBB3696623.1 hypothetical protein [Flammeovirga yaeyamensis]NMF33296.1 hypothetical protein [Flammeovirga yaeyamensis]QWG05425.1 hypothetical protein KMW28_23695 [Flammeovirga yaeyamensis]